MEKKDVVIVGGGVAGLAAAHALCLHSDLDVLLIEERRIGSNMTTPVVFPEALVEVGIEDSIRQYYTSFSFYSPIGARATFDYQGSVFASVDYENACAGLYSRAVGGGLMQRKAKALCWSPEIPDADRPLIVHMDNGDAIRTEILIDASGRAQWAARKLGIRLSPYYSICYGEFMTGCSFGENSTFCFLAPSRRYGSGGGWFYPIGQDAASMGYAVLADGPYQKEKTVKDGYSLAKREFEPFARWVRNGVVERAEGGSIPVGVIGRFVDNRILIVGDAAGQATPWCMMGFNTGIANGRLCARTVLNAFEKRRFDRSTLSHYERHWTRANREPFWRALSLIEPCWINRSDLGWDRVIESCKRVSPERHLQYMRFNETSLFHKVYAAAGYLRRKSVKWVRQKIGETCRPADL
jgi:flavin-dependent dehydrogenase